MQQMNTKWGFVYIVIKMLLLTSFTSHLKTNNTRMPVSLLYEFVSFIALEPCISRPSSYFRIPGQQAGAIGGAELGRVLRQVDGGGSAAPWLSKRQLAAVLRLLDTDGGDLGC